MLKFLAFIFFSIFIPKKSSILTKLIYDAEIILTIQGKGNQQILNNKHISLRNPSTGFQKDYSFNEMPSEILVNGIKINEIGFYVNNLTLEENIITIRYNRVLENCNIMFSELPNIIKINITKFDYSGTSLIGMFEGCNNLTSLELNNFNSKFVRQMDFMFYHCNKLISLDLRNMDTSSLTSMYGMFNGCTNLLSLDLSNFYTSSVTNMEYLFEGCSNLISLDLRNFIISSFSVSMTDILNNCNNDLVYCINSDSTILIETFKSYNFKYNCSDICFDENKKISLDNKKCVSNCIDNYEFEDNNICYSIKSNENHNLINDSSISGSNNPNKIIEIINIGNYTDKILNEFINLNFDWFIKENKDVIMKDNNIIYQLTSSNNQNNNKYDNISSIYLGECEKKLRLENNIDNNTELIILKIDIFENGFLIPIIEYDIYNSKTKEKLDLRICNYLKINISIPVKIDENNIFKYNSSNEYYTDFSIHIQQKIKQILY